MSILLLNFKLIMIMFLLVMNRESDGFQEDNDLDLEEDEDLLIT